MLNGLVEEKKAEPHILIFDKLASKDEAFERDDCGYDETEDRYSFIAGKIRGVTARCDTLPKYKAKFGRAKPIDLEP